MLRVVMILISLLLIADSASAETPQMKRPDAEVISGVGYLDVGRVVSKDPRVVYICIDGKTHVLMYGDSYFSGLSQLIDRDKDGLPMPVSCENRNRIRFTLEDSDGN